LGKYFLLMMAAGTIYFIEKLRTRTVGGSRFSITWISYGNMMSAQRPKSTFLFALSRRYYLLIFIHWGPLILLLMISNSIAVYVVPNTYL
jgi:hypothetical protein